MNKGKEITEFVESLDTKDLPEGNTLVYIDEEAVHLISHITEQEQMDETLGLLMSVSATMITDLLTKMADQGDIPEMAKDFVDAFEMTLSSKILKSPELIDKYLKSIMDIDEEEDETPHINTDKKMMH